MAEFRTIQGADICDIRTMRFLFALSDRYIVIPFPLSSLKLKARTSDPNILLIGPTGIFLISYHLVRHTPAPPPHFIEAVRDLEYSAQLLYDYLQPHELELPVFSLLLVVEDGNIQGSVSPNVSLIAWSKLRETIEEGEETFKQEQINAVLNILHAKSNYQRVVCYQILAEIERFPKQINYLAMHTIEDRPVLLKEIHTPFSMDNLEKNPMLRGAKLVQDLQHENIVRVEKLIPQDDRVFIVSEWCEGGITLKQYLEEQQDSIPLSSAIQLMKDLCSAMIYAHDHGVTHRNITPENLMVTPEHRLKVTNFGLAKRSGMMSLKTVDTIDLKKLTQENPYAAPEYILGTHQVDQRVDVYAVGIIFYELLTGRHPTHYDEELWEPPSHIMHGLPAYMDTLIARAIKFDRNQRYSTMHAFYSALEKGAEDLIQSRYAILKSPVPRETENSMLYKAQDTQTGQWVALKKLLIEPNTDRRTRLQKIQLILEQAKKMKNLAHPGLVTIYDTIIEDDDGYIVMEWVDGYNLREILNQYPENTGMVPESVRQMAIQIAEILQYVHHEGYIHGDLKPENMMCTPEGKITLLDCGLYPTNVTSEDGKKGPSGTLRYMAPELFNAQGTQDEKSDIFSFGVLMYELLTHRFPYENLWIQGNYPLDKDALPLAPTQLNTTVPHNLERIVMKALHPLVSERYDNMENLLNHLETCYESNNREAGEIIQEKQQASSWTKYVGKIAIICFLLSIIFLSIRWTGEGIGGKMSPIIEEVQYE